MVSNFMAKTKLSGLPNLNKDEMVEIGSHCSRQDCHQLDFLPFKCNKCSQQFCAEHWKVADHGCPKASINDDFRSPECPLCHAPISLSSASEDPNIPMSRHLDSLCPILFPSVTAKNASNNNRTCNLKGCNKKFIAGTDGVMCNGCGKRFCISHRFANDHSCSTSTSKLNSSNQSTSTGPRQVSAAGLAAIKRAADARLSSIPKTTLATFAQKSDAQSPNDDVALIQETASSLSESPKKPHALSPEARAIKKHSRKEAASAYMALAKRAQLGSELMIKGESVLSEEEKIRWASLQAEKAKGIAGNKKDECILC